MSLPELAADEIVAQLFLPTIQDVFTALNVNPSVLEYDVASPSDYHKKGNNPPSYSNVRSVREVIEDGYDEYVQDLYQDGQTQLDHSDVIDKFRQKINHDLKQFVVVKNTGRAYLAADSDTPLNI